MRAFSRASLLALSIVTLSCTPATAVIATCDAQADTCPKGKTKQCVKWEKKKKCEERSNGNRDSKEVCTTEEVCTKTECK